MATSVSVRELKEKTLRAHDRMFRNIKLLMSDHPPNKELLEVFKDDMLMKINKVAFQQVVYYLFHVLDPDLTKEKITWPLLEKKQETVFRNEVVAFIDLINAKYESAELPNFMPSYLVTPGGYKIISFLLKLSNVVVYEDMRKTDVLLAPIRPHETPAVTETIIKNVKLQTRLIEAQNMSLFIEFQELKSKSAEDAAKIVTEMDEVEAALAHRVKEVEAAKKERKGGNPEDLREKLQNLQEQMPDLKQVQQLCETANELLDHLNGNSAVLEFKSEEFQVPKSVQHLFKSSGVLDLAELFDSLSGLLENECTGLPTFTEEQLNEWLGLFNELNAQCAVLDGKLAASEGELEDIMTKFTLGSGVSEVTLTE